MHDENLHLKKLLENGKKNFYRNNKSKYIQKIKN